MKELFLHDVQDGEAALLSFDLERAKAGDAVQFYNCNIGKWIDCVFKFQGDGYGYACTYVLDGRKNTLQVFEKTNLRMKYPPMVK